ncbi:MAG: bifunctional metallophosphatase/5'-nucleotidase [Burkholderiaceae bacterium]
MKFPYALSALTLAAGLVGVACSSSDSPTAAPAPGGGGGGGAPAPSPAPITANITAKIIGFNDYHGTLFSPGNTRANSTATPVAAGGADYMAAYVASMRAQNPNNVVVGAGDLIGATPLVSALFNDEPSVETLNRIGLEFSAVGNHEFDKGSAELLRLQNGGCRRLADNTIDPNSCRGASVGTPVPYEGARFRWLAANVVVNATGQTVLPAFGTKVFNGVTVAFIGMTLRTTPTIVTPSGVAGLTFNDEAATVNALIPTLRAQGIESIVVLIHEGGVQTGTAADINQCAGDMAGSAIASIVSRLDNAVDLVVSGHTHQAYNCLLPNATGRRIPVTSTNANGRLLTEIDITMSPTTRDITAVVANNRIVDRINAAITPNATVLSIMTAYNNLVSPIANMVIGRISTALISTASDNACNVPAGDLITDAQLAATAPVGFGEAVIAFQNRGGIRTPGFTFPSSPAGEGDGNVTYGEAFTTQPFGNSLVTMTLTAQQIKNVLEEQFAGCRGQGATTTRIMIPSNGFKYTWNGANACDARISNVTLTRGGVTETIVNAAGVVVNPAQNFRVTVNNFMATGGDGYLTFTGGTNLLGGAQDIDALAAFIAGTRAPGAPFTPGVNPNDGGTARILRTGGTAGAANCPSGANTNP